MVLNLIDIRIRLIIDKSVFFRIEYTEYTNLVEIGLYRKFINGFRKIRHKKDISSHYLSLSSPPGPYRATTCRGRKLNYGSHTYFFDHTRIWRASPDEWSAHVGATSETAHAWKTIHTKHTLSHPNKANMEWWCRRPNDIRGPWGPKVSWLLSYRWGKTPKKPHPGNLSRMGIERGPAAWQARMLPLAPQRWTKKIISIYWNHE